MSESPASYFEKLRALLDQLADGRVRLTPLDVESAFDTLDQLERWCDAESTASAVNFAKWREAMRQLEATETLVIAEVLR